MSWILVIKEVNNYWNGRPPVITIHDTEERAKAALVAYVRRNWDKVDWLANIPSVDDEALIAAYFTWVSEEYVIGGAEIAITENRITEIKITLQPDTSWLVEVKKEFAPEYGGGSQVFRESGGYHVHRAIDVAKEMVTLLPATREGARS